MVVRGIHGHGALLGTCRCQGARRIIPALCKAISSDTANKSRNYIQCSLVRSSAEIPEAARHLIPEYLVKTHAAPPETSVAGEMDRTGISSQHLYNTLNWVLNADPELAPEMAKLCATRFDDLQDREWFLHSFEPTEKLAQNAPKRFRKVTLPAYLEWKNGNPEAINWQFTNEKARIKLKSLYPSI